MMHIRLHHNLVIRPIMAAFYLIFVIFLNIRFILFDLILFYFSSSFNQRPISFNSIINSLVVLFFFFFLSLLDHYFPIIIIITNYFLGLQIKIHAFHFVLKKIIVYIPFLFSFYILLFFFFFIFILFLI